MIVTDEDLTMLIQGVWDTCLGLEAEPAYGAPLADGQAYTAAVTVTGGWNGRIALVLPEPLARSAASAMFSLDPVAATSDDITDAAGELANTVGGNIKGLVDEPCALSLPSVSVSTADEHAPPAPDTAAFTTGDITFHVTVTDIP